MFYSTASPSSTNNDNFINNNSVNIIMADAATVSAQDFTTPDRSSLLHRHNHFEEKKDETVGSRGTTSIQGGASLTTKEQHLPPTVTPAVTVTPSEKATTTAEENLPATAADDDDNKQVRFDKDGRDTGLNTTSPASSVSGDSPSKRGLVSRRGRGSPGRTLVTSGSSPSTNEAHAAAAAVLEFKTFRSPERKQYVKDENEDTVPSLCSTGSVDRKEQQTKESGKESPKDENSSTSSKGQSTKPPGKASDPSSASTTKKSSVTFSPVPPPHNYDKYLKTPVRSPNGGRLASLPNFYDAPLGSPGAIFLSPTTPTKTKLAGDTTSGRAPLTPRTPRDRLLTTPTDFAFDYGKHPMSSGSLLDNSNVLSWLHSPSANGLFSPGGGLGSMMNTPKGGIPRTPGTPAVSSTSFFFSDVAGLPRGSESSSPNKKEKRDNNMICISPLSSHKAKHGTHSALSPKSPKFNMDMFASPAERSGMAKLGMKTTGVRAGNLDAVHLEDRGLMEDEDLSRLLQLASNTPRPSVPPPAVSSSSGGAGTKEPQKAVGNLPALSLPTIGGGDAANANSAKLTRKTQSRDLDEENQTDHSSAAAPPSSALNAVTPVMARSSDSNTKKSGKPVHSGMNPFMTSYHHHEAAYNPSLYPGMSHGGSMRVVVGGPPRPKTGTSPGTIRYTVGRPGEFPSHYPHPTHYPPHHGVPPHMHHQYAHYPPPPHHGTRHTPLYKTDPPAAAAAKKQPGTKAGAKRPAPAQEPKQTPAPKKTKKLTPPGGPKKKNRSPQLVEKADRQKAAATIKAVNQASGGKNDKAAALAAAILRGVTMRPSGKWQAQLYFAGKSRYIGVFDTREKAALAYEIARERLKAEKSTDGGPLSPKQTENAVNAARKAAFDGVNEQGP
ncbi:AP2 domain containing protein [Nitzschia inconspicua]|uniref:AP2 domain containing protein n=1 Tax=Nitzschia inconspicua TaxID=303405 RepID=A0A9K3LQR3_9STRA|nr:AP2 domain containing protein [Nitzschia inconspicua]